MMVLEVLWGLFVLPYVVVLAIINDLNGCGDWLSYLSQCQPRHWYSFWHFPPIFPQLYFWRYDIYSPIDEWL
jgi:hypothetical protein